MSNRLTIKGQVTIPKAVRDFLGLQEGGSSVEFTINDDGSVTVPRFRSPRSFTLRRVGTARWRYLIGCPSEWDESSAAAKAECCRLTF